MTKDNQSRRGFIREAGLATGAVLGTSILLPEPAAAQGRWAPPHPQLGERPR